MVKILSYRQKLIELAKIYKITKILDDKKMTTYEIESTLLRNKVPIPSRKSLFNLKLNKNVVKPLISNTNDIFYSLGKVNKLFLSIPKNIGKFFSLLFLSIKSFFSLISKLIINFLNDVYNFKVREDIVNKIISRTGYISLIVILGFGVFYIKKIATNMDTIKISFEIKPKSFNKDKSAEVDINKKLDTKKADKINKSLAKLPEKKSAEKKESQKIIKPKEPEAIKPKEEKKQLSQIPTNKSLKSSNEDKYNLNAATVLNLFEDLEYDLSEVRDEKKIKPIYFTRLPKDLDSIKNVQRKKDLFLQIVLPLVVAENEKIKFDRLKLKKILSSKMTTDKEKLWLRQKLRDYKVKKSDMKELSLRMDIVPTSIALAQAAKESGWGTSRFALEGNAIFGQWTWNGKGIEPLERSGEQTHKILKFPILRASVKAYITNLNTHNGYKDFRNKRLKLRKSNKRLKGLDLIHKLDNYAQTGKEYTIILEKIIRQNSLYDFENVEVQDNKKRKQVNL